jgi:hypothetical protein
VPRDIPRRGGRQGIPEVNTVGAAEQVLRFGMAHNPIGFPAAQHQFITENAAFLQEFREIANLLQKTFFRTLESPCREELERIEDLPDDSEPAREFMRRVMAERLVFYLGRILVDDFNELMTLAGNGLGFGALKILRSMFEHMVTAAFIAQNSSEAPVFLEDSPIKRGKIWNRTVKDMPSIRERYTAPHVDSLLRNYWDALARRKASVCKTCGQPVTQDAWTRVDLATMAEKTDPNLAVLYAPCYLQTTCHIHATGLGLELRLMEVGDTVTFREDSSAEAQQALLLGHNLILRMLTLQNNYFHLGLGDDITARADKFAEVWPGPKE